MERIEKSLAGLSKKIKEREQRTPLPFKDFLDLAAQKPRIVFRNIFQLFHDMIYSHVGKGFDEYPEDPESIGFICYDCAGLFEAGTDQPFFADRLFANRLIHHVASFRRGIRQNRIYIFEGPHGSGKSTFLNNLLHKFEQYTRTEDGVSFETVWRIEANQDYLEIPCPSHDNPLMLIPKAYRRDLIEELVEDGEFKEELFKEKQYEWVFKDSPCTVCTSMYQTLLDMFDSPSRVFEMLHARRYAFARRLGQGISVFNPGDRIAKTNVLTNPLLQEQLNSFFRDSNRVAYLYSRYANTNNGIYALMDIKAHNKERLTNLHGIISEGVHKVEDIEENVNSLFMAVMNPEDRENIADTQSFSDRITFIKISYVLDYKTEVKIYNNFFGDQIKGFFLPRVLENFAKVIISTRLEPRSEGMREWIPDPGKYKLYCDRNLQLLKMDIYTGLIPEWLTEEDRKNFTAKRRQKILAESETEGDKGFTGRDSIKIFTEFFAGHARKDKPITMAMVCSFFKKLRASQNGSIPDGFLEALTSQYNYAVLQEVKESLYFFNEERISEEIQNYLFAVNFDPGRTERCVFTGEEIEITEDFFEVIELRILGPQSLQGQRKAFRKDVQNQYASKTLTQEIVAEGKNIRETQIYQSLFQKYAHNLKENVLDPFLKNDNFRSAIKDYETETFRSYDKRIREDVSLLIRNLTQRYSYTELGAREVCIYVIDNGLARTFARD